MPSKYSQVELRLPAEVITALKASAKKHSRSVDAEIGVRLAAHLEERAAQPTLRDEFAKAAMQALLTATTTHYTTQTGELCVTSNITDAGARLAYKMADHMLAVRGVA